MKSTKPTSKIYIKDIDTINDDTNIEYAIGVGIASQFISAQGYKAIDTTDIIDDVINGSKTYDAEQLIENTFPAMLKGNVFVPIFKYLRDANLINKNATLNTSGLNKLKNKFQLKPNIPACFLPPASYIKKQAEIRRNHKDVSSIEKAYDKNHSLLYIQLLEHKNIDLVQLHRYLRTCFKDESIKRTTAFRKLVCLYDYLKFGLNS